MDGLIALNLFLVAVFILLTAFFVGAEFAILKVRMSRIDQLIAEGNKKAIVAKKVAQNLDYYLSACQLGITITALVLGALGEPTVEKMLHPLFERFDVPAALSTVLSYGIALAVVTFLHVVVGELAPKTLAIQYAEKLTLMLAPGLYRFGIVTKPFINALNGSSRTVLRWFGIKPTSHETVHSEEELKLIVRQSYESGEINQTEMVYLKNIFAFDNRLLKEIMIPKAEIITLKKEMSFKEMLSILEEYEYTRYPVITEKRELVGYVNAKEMLTSKVAGRNVNMADYIHEMPIFLQSAPIKSILLKMQQSRVHMALVKNEQGEIVGLVTMEDILEEIVGEIREEHLGESLAN
ncbi:MAG TPA: hemolysin family protein [Niallia sp.]|nr:hemolysin family protein [Niallia sp.]